MDLKHLLKTSRMRWSLTAHDICYTCWQHAYFFSLGKCIPVIRGSGVYQQAVDFCIDRLTRGEWVHIFPEGIILKPPVALFFMARLEHFYHQYI